MSVNDWLIQLSLAMSNYRALDLDSAPGAVAPWFAAVFAPLVLLDSLAFQLLQLPIVGFVMVPVWLAADMVTTIYFWIATAVAMLGSSLLVVVCGSVVPLLAHATAVGWAIWRACGGA